MAKWEYCEVHVQLTKGHERAIVLPTFGDARELEGSDARFPQLFRMLGQEGWEAVGFVSSRFTSHNTDEGTVIDEPGVDTKYLLKRQIAQG